MNSLKPTFQNKGESLNTNSILFYFQPGLHTLDVSCIVYINVPSRHF